MIILIMVIRSGYEILKDSMKSLLDASVDRSSLIRIEAVIKGFSPVKEIVAINARNSGRFIFMELDLTLALKRLRGASKIADSIEKEIKSQIPLWKGS